eukprot:9388911-Pyramimonas_sp.AAC.1
MPTVLLPSTALMRASLRHLSPDNIRWALLNPRLAFQLPPISALSVLIRLGCVLRLPHEVNPPTPQGP